MNAADTAALARRLLAAFDEGTTLAPIGASHPGFDVAAAYDVLREIERMRVARGWRPVGRKIGFTNRTLWPRYGVDRPMWAHVWAETVIDAPEGQATLSLDRTTEPRIEPEVVFGLRGPVTATDDARIVLDAVSWIAPGFEMVQSQFPGWKFSTADCTAAFGLHRALVVGPRVALADADRDRLAAALPVFEATLRRGSDVIERGVGANVLDSPALALGHLARVLDGQPAMPRLAAGEIVTTGTLTDAWPVGPGETWSSDYGALGIPGIALRFT
ncbi:MAG: decarboxylase [Burkholderiales bacterium]